MDNSPFQSLSEAYNSIYEGSAWLDTDTEWDRKPKKEKTAKEKRENKEVKEERDPSHPHWETNRQFKKSQKKNKELIDKDQQRSTMRKLHQNPTFFGNNPTNRLTGKLSKNERNQKEEFIIDYLLDEGFVNNEVSAEVFIEHMSDEWLDNILEAAADQSNKQIEKGVKTTYKAGNVLDNLHQGRSPGMDKLPATERKEKEKRMRGRLKTRRDDLFGERNKREDEERAEMKKRFGL